MRIPLNTIWEANGGNCQRFLKDARAQGCIVNGDTILVDPVGTPTIEDTVERYCEFATALQHSLQFDFSGIEVTCPPNQGPHLIVAAWWEQMSARTDKAEAMKTLPNHMLLLGRLDWEEPEHVFLWLRGHAELQKMGATTEDWAIFQTLLNHDYKGIPPIPFREDGTFEEGWAKVAPKDRYRWCVGILLPYLAHGIPLPWVQIDKLMKKCKLPYDDPHRDDYDSEAL